MKFKGIVLISILCISSVAAFAQTAETFRQPYPLGKKLSPTPNFTGEVWLAPLSEKKELNVPMSNVTFEPGCRNSWHSHKAGQLFDVEHWHGAAPDSWFAHVAITCNPQINAPVWLQPVSDEQYREATTEAESRYAEANKVLSAREQAIVVVASYTGKGDLEHLKPAVSQALEAGMTIKEVNEVLKQLTE